jgi:hypothetical protein
MTRMVPMHLNFCGSVWTTTDTYLEMVSLGELEVGFDVLVLEDEESTGVWEPGPGLDMFPAAEGHSIGDVVSIEEGPHANQLMVCVGPRWIQLTSGWVDVDAGQPAPPLMAKKKPAEKGCDRLDGIG